MAKVFIEETTLTSIGDAIRNKEGTAELIPPLEMAERIEAIGGGVEYTTGRVTYGNTYGDKKILHGLSKKPKLFILRMDGYNTVAGTTLCGAFYTEVIAGLFRNNEATMPSVGFLGAATVPEIEMAATNGVTADDTQFVIHNPTTRYTAGDYTWEAWTW